jgi:hypothetical protein
MPAEDRKAREEKVIEAVRGYLPDVQRGSGVVIQIEACEKPEKHDGGLFINAEVES